MIIRKFTGNIGNLLKDETNEDIKIDHGNNSITFKKYAELFKVKEGFGIIGPNINTKDDNHSVKIKRLPIQISLCGYDMIIYFLDDDLDIFLEQVLRLKVSEFSIWICDLSKKEKCTEENELNAYHNVELFEREFRRNNPRKKKEIEHFSSLILDRFITIDYRKLYTLYTLSERNEDNAYEKYLNIDFILIKEFYTKIFFYLQNNYEKENKLEKIIFDKIYEFIVKLHSNCKYELIKELSDIVLNEPLENMIADVKNTNDFLKYIINIINEDIISYYKVTNMPKLKELDYIGCVNFNKSRIDLINNCIYLYRYKNDYCDYSELHGATKGIIEFRDEKNNDLYLKELYKFDVKLEDCNDYVVIKVNNVQNFKRILYYIYNTDKTVIVTDNAVSKNIKEDIV